MLAPNQFLVLSLRPDTVRIENDPASEMGAPAKEANFRQAGILVNHIRRRLAEKTGSKKFPILSLLPGRIRIENDPSPARGAPAKEANCRQAGIPLDHRRENGRDASSRRSARIRFKKVLRDPG